MPRRKKGLLYLSDVNKYLDRFPGLEYTGTYINCRICNIGLVGRDVTDCRKHIKSKRHVLNLKNPIPYWQFLYDFIFLLSVCNIPQQILDNEHFQLFWDKYVPSWKLPTKRQLRSNLKHVQGIVKDCVRNELKNNKIWLSVDATTDAQKHSVMHVLACTLKPNGPSVSLLLSSRRIQENNAETVVQIIQDALRDFCITGGQLTMLVTEGDATMLKVGRMLKMNYPHLLHTICLLHTCHLVVEAIRSKYPLVNNLIVFTKKVFVKSPKHVGLFKELYPELPLPPQLVITRWGTWLEAVFYYNKYFTNVKDVISKFNANESGAVRECQQLFSDLEVKRQIDEICTNYLEVNQTISRLQNNQLSLVESLNIVDNLQTVLDKLTDTIGLDVAQELRRLLNKNPDLQEVRSIIESQECIDEVKEYLSFANMTLLDVERSFSQYKNTFSSFRRNLSESTMESLLMLQFYASYLGGHMPQWVSRHQ